MAMNEQFIQDSVPDGYTSETYNKPPIDRKLFNIPTSTATLLGGIKLNPIQKS
jgi:hypothetical protein